MPCYHIWDHLDACHSAHDFEVVGVVYEHVVRIVDMLCHNTLCVQSASLSEANLGVGI